MIGLAIFTPVTGLPPSVQALLWELHDRRWDTTKLAPDLAFVTFRGERMIYARREKP